MSKQELKAADAIWRTYDDETYLKMLAAKHPFVSWRRRWIPFNVKHHLITLHLDDSFLKGITSRTKLLILGEGSGRLADYFFRKTRVLPENMVLVDKAYTKRHTGLKKKVFLYWKQGRLQLKKNNFFNGVEGKFHHILIPEAVFPISRHSVDPTITFRDYQKLLENNLPNLEPGGTLRATWIPEPDMSPPNLRVRRFKAFLDGLTKQGYAISEKNNTYIITSPATRARQ